MCICITGPRPNSLTDSDDATKPRCELVKSLGWTLLAVSVLTVALGAIAYFSPGLLTQGASLVGSMSSQAGFNIFLGGLGATALAALILTAKKCVTDRQNGQGFCRSAVESNDGF